MSTYIYNLKRENNRTIVNKRMFVNIFVVKEKDNTPHTHP